MSMPVLLTNLIMVPLIIHLIEEIYIMLFLMIFSLLQKAIVCWLSYRTTTPVVGTGFEQVTPGSTVVVATHIPTYSREDAERNGERSLL